MVTLAAPVWSHSHNHRHKHRRQACHGGPPTTAVPYATKAVEALAAVETTLTTQIAQTSVASSIQTSQSTASAASATSTAKTPGRAIWLWSSNLIKETTEVDQFLSFAESNDITSVYTLIDRDMGNAVFESFIQQCNASGIAVEALMGNSEWILGEGDPTLESQLDWLEQYQGNVSTSAQFSGIHMDVEVSKTPV
jgi:hypothetical protein